MNPEKIRKDFPIFQQRKNLVYLDNAATSQKPEKVTQAITNFYQENNSNVGRGLYDLANDATKEYRDARKIVSDFIGASRSEIVYVRNTTEAENLLAHSLEFEGDIVLSEMAHHSEQLPWRRKAEKEGKSVEYLETEEGKISTRSIEEKIDQDTGLVAVSHISNVFGAENHVDEIVDVAHENDALVVLDAAQSAPHMPLDVEELGVDFLCFSGHKMLGPSSIGVLYGRRELLQDMEPYQVGGGMIKSVQKNNVAYEDAPEKFEAGTENVAGAVVLAAAIEYLEEVGMEEIYSHDKELAGIMIEELKQIEGVNVLSPDDASLVSFTADWAHPHDIAEVLNQHGVAVRAGNHCAQPQMEELGITGTTRASPYLYNTEEDVEKFLEAVKDAKEAFEV
ncbi:aminotransferase class V-fold PLP-dependent enzyme [Candidatus Nanohalobium constans]|uniref:cysteine desulfurase n=1 Tax=Candidatus Nanohalobium constans TaxID=2565781 RepID=A0A5Q0UF34_9ARCH|nr:cysteine desulfurase [Candidatus Nanohalobium constans]QGA80168.1 cysteine desulfurase / selenocysteine lyase [Candidatus Nanohalobium constans]